jgi:hypothetical protein
LKWQQVELDTLAAPNKFELKVVGIKRHKPSPYEASVVCHPVYAAAI